MGHKKDINFKEKEDILNLWDNGATTVQIAKN